MTPTPRSCLHFYHCPWKLLLFLSAISALASKRQLPWGLESELPSFVASQNARKHLQAFLYKCPETSINSGWSPFGTEDWPGKFQKGWWGHGPEFPGWWHRYFLTSFLKQLLKVPNTPQADGSDQNHCLPTPIIKAHQLFSFLILHIVPNLNGKRKVLVKAFFLKMPSSPPHQQSHGFCSLNSSSKLFYAFINKHMYTYRYA